MNEEQRDELLITMAERVRDIKEEELPEIRTHLAKLNESVVNHSIDISDLKTKANRTWLLILAVIAGSGSIGAGVTKLLEFLS